MLSTVTEYMGVLVWWLVTLAALPEVVVSFLTEGNNFVIGSVSKCICNRFSSLFTGPFYGIGGKKADVSPDGKPLPPAMDALIVWISEIKLEMVPITYSDINFNTIIWEY